MLTILLALKILVQIVFFINHHQCSSQQMLCDCLVVYLAASVPMALLSTFSYMCFLQKLFLYYISMFGRGGDDCILFQLTSFSIFRNIILLRKMITIGFQVDNYFFSYDLSFSECSMCRRHTYSTHCIMPCILQGFTSS